MYKRQTIASIVDDSITEGSESVILTLSSPSNASLGSDSVHTYTITDNDSAPVVDFNTTSSSGAESVSSNALTVDLSASSTQGRIPGSLSRAHQSGPQWDIRNCQMIMNKQYLQPMI